MESPNSDSILCYVKFKCRRSLAKIWNSIGVDCFWRNTVKLRRHFGKLRFALKLWLDHPMIWPVESASVILSHPSHSTPRLIDLPLSWLKLTVYSVLQLACAHARTWTRYRSLHPMLNVLIYFCEMLLELDSASNGFSVSRVNANFEISVYIHCTYLTKVLHSTIPNIFQVWVITTVDRCKYIHFDIRLLVARILIRIEKSSVGKHRLKYVVSRDPVRKVCLIFLILKAFDGLLLQKTSLSTYCLTDKCGILAYSRKCRIQPRCGVVFFFNPFFHVS